MDEALGAKTYDGGKFPEAIALFKKLVLAKELEAFLTLSAYRMIA